MFAQLYFLLYCPSVFGTAGLSGNSHPRPQALRPTRPVHTELRRTWGYLFRPVLLSD